MKVNSLLFLVGECCLNIRRNGLMSLAALGTVTVALTVLGGSLWSAHRLHEYAQLQPQRFNLVTAFLQVEATREQTEAVQARIRLLPDVKQVRIVPKEKAWAHLQSTEPTQTVGVPDNPLPDALEVEAIDAAHVDPVTRHLRDRTQFPEFDYVNDESEMVRTLLGFARLVRMIGGGAAIGLFIATLFIVYNTIRLTVFARRREIRIMQLVGATPGFIRFPLLLEGIFHGIVGAGIASAIVLLCGHEVSLFITQHLKSPLFAPPPSYLGPLDVAAGLIAIGAFVGFFGSYLSMRRFLRQT